MRTDYTRKTERNGRRFTVAEKAILALIILIVGCTVIDEARGQEVPVVTAEQMQASFDDSVRDIVDEAILDIRYDAPLWSTTEESELHIELLAPISRAVALGIGYKATSRDELVWFGERWNQTRRHHGMITVRARVRLGKL